MLRDVRFDTSDLEVERVEVKIGEEAPWQGVQVRLLPSFSCLFLHHAPV